MPLHRRRTMPPVRLPPLAAQPSDAAMPTRAFVQAPRTPAAAPTGRRLTITADDVDVGEIVRAIAKATGFNVIVATQVHVRVSVALFDLTVEEAIQAIVDVAGFSVLPPAAPGNAAIVVSKPPRD
jgi:type II secretory pathway component HofQ